MPWLITPNPFLEISWLILFRGGWYKFASSSISSSTMSKRKYAHTRNFFILNIYIYCTFCPTYHALPLIWRGAVMDYAPPLPRNGLKPPVMDIFNFSISQNRGLGVETYVSMLGGSCCWYMLTRYTVDSLYLEHPLSHPLSLSRTKVSVPLCTL